MKFNSKNLSLKLNLLFCLFGLIILIFIHKFFKLKINFQILLTFTVYTMIISKKLLIVNTLSDTFDDFVDDLLSSDIYLLKGELDFLLMQNLFNSIDLKLINKNEIEDYESLAA